MSPSSTPEFGGQALPDIDAHWSDWLTRAAQLRGVRDGVAEGMSVEAVADSVGMAVEAVAEMTESLDRGADVEVGAYEIAVRAHVEGSSRRQLVDQLSVIQYTETRQMLPWPLRGLVPGTWEGLVRMCRVQGLLTEEELAEIALRRGPLTVEPPIHWSKGRGK